MKLSTVKWIFLSALAALITSCTTIKVESWKDPEVMQRDIGKTMVLALSESDSLCRQYETLFASRLNELNVNALTAHSLIGNTDNLEKNQLVALLKENGFKSILVTRVISENQRSVPGGMSNFPTYYASYWGYYSSRTVVAYAGNGQENDIYQEFRLETNLYDVKSTKLIWSGRNVIYDDRTAENNMKGVILAAIKDLELKGLIQ